MAFAAASDLLTMTISNRMSLALVAGFLVLALPSGMGTSRFLSHVGAGADRARRGLWLLRDGLGRRRRRQGGGRRRRSGSASIHLLTYLLYASLFGGALTLLLL